MNSPSVPLEVGDQVSLNCILDKHVYETYAYLETEHWEETHSFLSETQNQQIKSTEVKLKLPVPL